MEYGPSIRPARRSGNSRDHPPLASPESTRRSDRRGEGTVWWPLRKFDSWLAGPLHDFQMITGLTVLLTVSGLMMVLSSSSVEALVNLGSTYARFVPQTAYAFLGAVLFVLVVRTPTSVLRRAAPWFLLVSFVLLGLVLVPGIGSEQYGAQSWIFIGSISFQPSEIAKVSLAIWCAHLVARAKEAHGEVDMVLRTVLAVNVAVLVLVVLQRDLGTAVTLGIILMSVLWFGGFRTRTIAAIAAGCGVGFIIFTLTVGYRSDRIRAFLNPDLDPQGLNYQGTQAKYALANGGLLGKGLGQSDSKWSYLPQAYNDFIFAIIGEELGAVGAMAVIGLFAGVLWVGLRIAVRSTDPFLQVLSSIATVWIVMQAFINIAYVVGILPITGLQLPLISAGGTSMLTTLLMFGLIAHAAYREPEALVSLESNTHPLLITRIFGRPRILPSPVSSRKTRRRTPPPPHAGPARTGSARTPRAAHGDSSAHRKTGTRQRSSGRTVRRSSR